MGPASCSSKKLQIGISDCRKFCKKDFLATNILSFQDNIDMDDIYDDDDCYDMDDDDEDDEEYSSERKSDANHNKENGKF